MTAFDIQLMTGIVFLVVGLSYLIRAGDWFVLLDHLQKKGRYGSLLTGVILLFTGSFIISFHWIWQGMAVIVSLTGVILVLKGAICLLYPYWLPAKLARLEHYNLTGMIRIAGIVLIILSGFILYSWSDGGISSNHSFTFEPPFRKTTITEIAGRII